MHRRLIATLSLLALATLALGAARLGPQQPADGRTAWNVDNVHSTVLFKVRHLGVSNFYGRFNEVRGTILWDEKNPDTASLEIEVPTASLDTNAQGRDQHLRGPQFFAVEEHPTMTFRSTRVKARGGVEFKLEGDLTLLGETRKVPCRLQWFGSRDAGPRFGERCGLEARFTILRSAFGMDTYVKEGVLGDEVEIIVSIEGVKAKPAEPEPEGSN